MIFETCLLFVKNFNTENKSKQKSDQNKINFNVKFLNNRKRKLVQNEIAKIEKERLLISAKRGTRKTCNTNLDKPQEPFDLATYNHTIEKEFKLKTDNRKFFIEPVPIITFELFD